MIHSRGCNNVMAHDDFCLCCCRDIGDRDSNAPQICIECWDRMSAAERAQRYEAMVIMGLLNQLTIFAANNDGNAAETARLAKAVENLTKKTVGGQRVILVNGRN